jgi:FMN phosphatase YigB (HAD superfamily)
MHLPFELVLSSASLGVAKPDVDFFLSLAERLALPPACVAYVGDRLDNDVEPAIRAGMVAVHLRRGPWGLIQSTDPRSRPAEITIESLSQLPTLLAKTCF